MRRASLALSAACMIAATPAARATVYHVVPSGHDADPSLASRDRGPMDYAGTLFADNHLYNRMLLTREERFRLTAYLMRKWDL